MMKTRETLLFDACEIGHEGVVRALLSDAATEVNMTSRGMTPLFIACDKGHEGVVRLLLSHAATEVNKTSDDYTPLFIACDKGHEGVVRLLLSHAADLDKISKDDWGDDNTPLFIAIEKGHEKVVRLILNHSPTHMNKKYNGRTPLYTACWSAGSNEEVVRLLLNNDKINVNQANDYDSWITPTIAACDSENISNMKLLLSDGRTYRNRPTDEKYAKVYDEALRNVKSERNARFRGLIRAIVVFRRMRLRAALKVYAPGGAGFQAASASFYAAANC